MIAGRLALLFGLFVAPAILLRLGHQLRGRPPRGKRRFWGGVAGWLTGLLAATAAMLVPAVAWGGGDAGREAIVHWAMAIGFVAGVALSGGVRRG